MWLGHNRRFSALSSRVLEHLRGIGPRQVTCTVRAAGVPADSWYQSPVEGGGTLFGDVCHFLDLCIWFQESLPTEVSALATPDPSHREESWAITLRFANGGLGVVHYVCGSEKGWERETVDVLGGGRSARIAGFRTLTLNGGRGRNRSRMQPDLGQRRMLEGMVAQFSRTPGATDYTESFLVSAQALLAARRSLAEGRIVPIEPRFPFAIG
jgi:predicted dehydrogenase